ncbi:unnamed protein product [Periconia digitata]|uniref:Uncharacterized protein n=1 Tax=Periconia digitata TaxID=1303443 RepID=A0A9W4UQ68_9PLEO|nr:unnamed protein product [Periconia digitata]
MRLTTQQASQLPPILTDTHVPYSRSCLCRHVETSEQAYVCAVFGEKRSALHYGHSCGGAYCPYIWKPATLTLDATPQRQTWRVTNQHSSNQPTRQPTPCWSGGRGRSESSVVKQPDVSQTPRNTLVVVRNLSELCLFQTPPRSWSAAGRTAPPLPRWRAAPGYPTAKKK